MVVLIFIISGVIGWENTYISMIVAVLLLILNIIFSFIFYKLQRSFMLEKDSRMRSLEEMMSGIKSIKYNSLEPIFDRKMQKKRNKEINKLFT